MRLTSVATGETKKPALHTLIRATSSNSIAGEKQDGICPDSFLLQPRHLHSLASSLQGGAGNPKLLNSTLEPHDFSAHSLDSQLHVGPIPCLVVRFSFVRTHEGIYVTEPVQKIIALTWLMHCKY